MQSKIAFYYLSRENKNNLTIKKRKRSDSTKEITVYKKQRK